MTARTWAIDGERTHGEKHLALITDEVHHNIAGDPPDFLLHLTTDELVTWLVAAGYREIDTDVEELQREWDRVPFQARWDEQRAADRAAWNAYDEADTATRIKLHRANREEDL